MDVSDAAWKLLLSLHKRRWISAVERSKNCRMPLDGVCVNNRILERLVEFLSRTSGLIIWNRSRGWRQQLQKSRAWLNSGSAAGSKSAVGIAFWRILRVRFPSANMPSIKALWRRQKASQFAPPQIQHAHTHKMIAYKVTKSKLASKFII